MEREYSGDKEAANYWYTHYQAQAIELNIVRKALAKELQKAFTDFWDTPDIEEEN